MDTPAWVTDSIFYEIFPDRFAQSTKVPRDGLNLEAWESPPTLRGFKGGDLYGVLDHLDYLQDLGANALYLTPVFASAANHRYHTYDYFQVDPLLGGNAALRQLVDGAHDRRMHIVLDGVFNHASRGFWQFHHTLENGSASPYIDWFHFDEDRVRGLRHWGAYPGPEETQALQHDGSLRAIGYEAWWDLPALPKFNTKVPAVREFLFSVAEHWIRFGIDGWRLDVPAEIDDDSFWQEFRRRVRAANPEAYLVGELWQDGTRWLQGDQFDASMNYPITAACIGFFTGGNLDIELAMRAGGFRGQLYAMDAQAFADRVDWCLGLYDPDVARVQLTPLDTHDTPRFLSCARGDVASLRLAIAFLLAFPGAPCLFYGDEIGMEGGHDPDCRKSFPWAKHAWNMELHDYVKSLIHLRLMRPSLRWGKFARRYSDSGVYAFERALESERTLIVLNASDGERLMELPIGAPTDRFPKLIFGTGAVEAAGNLKLRISARSALMLDLGGNGG